MSSTLHLILRCDHGTRDTRCRDYFIGPSSSSIVDVRDAAADKGWTFKPGQPYRHIGATDLCKTHSKAGNDDKRTHPPQGPEVR